MNRPGQSFAYDARVVGTVQEKSWSDYRDAQLMINRGPYDVLSVQHEFGIYGGENSEYLAEMLAGVKIPVITTLHTVLRKPSEAMRQNLRAVARHSDRIMIMNSLAVEILAKVYGIDPGKVTVIHHGAPVPSRERQRAMKQYLRLDGLKVISTFGLLSSSKGLEHAIEAMPRIVEAHPEAVYLILGQTHPVVQQEEGEQYREGLKALARKLGIEHSVRFVDKYFTKAELIAYLLASDIYLTPYLNMEQVTSGTLAYAMACGRPLVSTPYLYAQFLLGEERGLLVPPRDPAEIADACLHVLNNPDLKARMEQANWRYGQKMLWPRVGYEYLQLLQEEMTTTTVPSQPVYLRARA
jgi:glycosyltransferase involved in cell wall biosynthesis